MTIQPHPKTRGCVHTSLARIALLLLLPAIGLILQDSASAEEVKAEKNTCIECHSRSRFLVQNKKLYDYYQQWQTSIHAQDEITCDDCHGGNPDASKKEDSHKPGVGQSDPASGVHFTNVIDTCGTCHEEILDGFKNSKHFKSVAKEEQEELAPTCVTCHGSINVEVLNVNSVAEACARCHNEESDNHPEHPEKAGTILNRFLSINRYYRYMSHRIDPNEAQAFFKKIDEKIHHLSITWHTFDLEEIDIETKDLLDRLKNKRDEIKAKSKAAKDTGTKTE